MFNHIRLRKGTGSVIERNGTEIMMVGRLDVDNDLRQGCINCIDESEFGKNYEADVDFTVNQNSMPQMVTYQDKD